MKGRKKISLILGGMLTIACVSCSKYSVSEQQTESFVKYYPLDVDDNEGVDILQTQDGGYVILANYNQEDSDKDIMLIFCDEFGRKETNSPIHIGTAGYDLGNCILNISDGFIIAGSAKFGSLKLGLLSKVSNSGQLIWQNTYSGYPEMEFNEVIRHQDGGYVMAGHITDNSGEKEILMFKTSSEGDSLWAREIGYAGYDDTGESLERYQDRLLVVGTTSPRNQIEFSRLIVLNTDLDGRGIFALRISGEQNLSGDKIILDPDGDVFIMGNEQHSLTEEYRIYLAKINLTGSNLEQVEVDRYSYLSDVNSLRGEDLEPVEAGYMAICGRESILNDVNVFFMIVDDNLDIINRQSFGSKGYQEARSIYYTSDGGYSLAGSIDLGGGITTMILKLNSEGILQ